MLDVSEDKLLIQLVFLKSRRGVKTWSKLRTSVFNGVQALELWASQKKSQM